MIIIYFLCSHVSPDESLRPYVSRGRRSVSVCSNLRGMQYATMTTSQELLRLVATRHISAETSTRCFGELFQDETVWLTQEVKYYNLDVIISVGYRVNASLPMMGLTSTSTLEKVRKQNRNTRNIRKSRRNRSIWKVLRNRTRHPISCSMPRQKPSAR